MEEEEAALSGLIHQCEPTADVSNDAPVHRPTERRGKREAGAHLSPGAPELRW